MSNIDIAKFELLPDSDFEDADEYPDDNQMLRDIETAFAEFAEFERGERTLCVTQRLQKDSC